MASYITTSISNGVTLGSGYVSPLTITSTGTVAYSGYAAVTAGYAVQITNNGVVGNTGTGYGIRVAGGSTIANTGSIYGGTGSLSGVGIFLDSGGGNISNSSTGVIAGAYRGIFSTDSVTVVNSGTVAQTSLTAGSLSAGIYSSGGFITNNAHALISGNTGVYLTAQGTIINSGAILGNNVAVSLAGGGVVTNNTRAVIQGGYTGIFAGGAAASTVTNNGVVYGGSGPGVRLRTDGAVVNNQARGTINGGVDLGGSLLHGDSVTNNGIILSYYTNAVGLSEGGTVTNSARIVYAGTSGAGNWGVSISNGGVVTNNRNGLIIGGIHNDGSLTPAATVVNSGTILSTRTGVDLRGGGTVINSGTIYSAGLSYTAVGVYLAGGSTLVNNGSAFIAGYYGVYAGNTATITNNGTIASYGPLGVYLKNGGVLTNNSGGAINGPNIGVYALGGPATIVNHGLIKGGAAAGIYLLAGGTVTNSGTINGSYAIEFHGGGNNRLILESGSKLLGTVAGSTDAGATNTLELGSTASAGTLSGLDSQFVNFGTVTLDTGAAWLFSGTNTIDNGITLTDFGTLTNTGALTIAGHLIVDPATFVNSGSVSGEVTLTAGSYLNNSGTIQNTGNAVSVASGAATVVNSGSIIGSSPFGIYLNTGGLVINNAGGLIRGGSAAIQAASGAGTVVNSGSIIGATNFGVNIGAGGTVTNNVSASIEGSTGLRMDGAGTVTLFNSGTILGDGGPGVNLYSNATITNNAAGLLEGSIGVLNNVAATTVVNSGAIIGTSGAGIYLKAGGTVVNTGTINGQVTAMYFLGAGNSRLVLESGYAVGGAVTVSGTANTLELLGAAGDVGVGFNSHGLNAFDTVQFGVPSGHREVLTISDTATMPGTIASFTTIGDVIDITQLSPTGLQAPTLQSGHQLVVTNGSQSVTLNLDSENYSSVSWQATPDNSGGTDVAVACYCRGTMMLTEHGEVPVEELRIGDRVATLSGALRPVKWIGRRTYDPRFVAGNCSILPIHIAAGAFGDGLPQRDLRVSPEHALFVAGVLVAAKLLINGTTITQIDAVETLQYFHIELATHDVLLAEGLPAESYVECDNRGMFHNADEYAQLYPNDFSASGQFCAARLSAAASELAAIRDELYARALALGHYASAVA